MRKILDKYSVDWGHIILLNAVLIIILFYLFDAVLSSKKIENLMMILPVSLIGIFICFWQMVLSIKPRHTNSLQPSSSVSDDSRQLSAEGTSATRSNYQNFLFKFRVPIFMGLLGTYLLGLIFVAFDLATFLFIWLSLVFQGERRKILAFIYALLFSLLVTWCLKLMVPFPFTTVFF